MGAHPGSTIDVEEEVAWETQRHAQRCLGLEDRIRQNDALAGLWARSTCANDRPGNGPWVGGPSR